MTGNGRLENRGASPNHHGRKQGAATQPYGWSGAVEFMQDVHSIVGLNGIDTPIGSVCGGSLIYLESNLRLRCLILKIGAEMNFCT